MPGIFELLATENLIADAFVVLDKLEYGQWKNWLGNEKDSIVAFLFAWWEDLIKNKSSFDNEAFIAVCKLTEDRDKLLDSWTISFDDYSFNNFVELVHDYYSDLSGKKKEFKELDHKSIEKLIDWIKRSSVMLERGFFHFESKDQKYAEKVSETLYIFERMG